MALKITIVEKAHDFVKNTFKCIFSSISLQLMFPQLPNSLQNNLDG